MIRGPSRCSAVGLLLHCKCRSAHARARGSEGG
jgi:hypothetical protein